MTGIMEWLRGDHVLSQADREEAADEIERLEAEIDRLEAEIDDMKSANGLLHGLVDNRDAEIERLRAEIASYEKARAYPDENDCCVAFQAEIERLQETIVDRELEIKDHLREIERLRTGMAQAEQNWAADWKREVEKLEAERLQANFNPLDEADRASLAYCIAQFRHAYTNLMKSAVRDQKQFADGLLAPQIRFLESLVAKYPPHA